MSRQYLSAGKIVEEVALNGRSFKRLCSSKASMGKTDYALAAQTLKFLSILQEIHTKAEISAENLDVGTGVLLVMSYEALFGSKGKIQGGGAVKRRIMEHMPAMKCILAEMMVEKASYMDLLSADVHAASVMPQYLRVNTMKVPDLDLAIQYVREKNQHATMDEHIPFLIKIPRGPIQQRRTTDKEQSKQQSAAAAESAESEETHAHENEKGPKQVKQQTKIPKLSAAKDWDQDVEVEKGAVTSLLSQELRTTASASASFGQDEWVKDGRLIIQDKASCFPAQVLIDSLLSLLPTHHHLRHRRYHSTTDMDCDTESVSSREERGVVQGAEIREREKISYGGGINGGVILDACAAPGNKTSHIAALLNWHSCTRTRHDHNHSHSQTKTDTHTKEDGISRAGNGKKTGNPGNPGNSIILEQTGNEALLVEDTMSKVLLLPSRVIALDKNVRRAQLLEDRMLSAGVDNIVKVFNTDFLSVHAPFPPALHTATTASAAAGRGVDVAGNAGIQDKSANNCAGKGDDWALDVVAILLDPSCSGSGVMNAWERVVENSHAKIGENSRNGGGIGSSLEANSLKGEELTRVEKLKEFQISMLRHAMDSSAFPHCKTIVYSTCSVHQLENEDVVGEALRDSAAADWQDGNRGWSERTRVDGSDERTQAKVELFRGRTKRAVSEATLGDGKEEEEEDRVEEEVQEEENMHKTSELSERSGKLGFNGGNADMSCALCVWKVAEPAGEWSKRWVRRGIPQKSNNSTVRSAILDEKERNCVMRCHPSDGTNGFFVALFTREFVPSECPNCKEIPFKYKVNGPPQSVQSKSCNGGEFANERGVTVSKGFPNSNPQKAPFSVNSLAFVSQKKTGKKRNHADSGSSSLFSSSKKFKVTKFAKKRR